MDIKTKPKCQLELLVNLKKKDSLLWKTSNRYKIFKKCNETSLPINQPQQLEIHSTTFYPQHTHFLPFYEQKPRHLISSVNIFYVSAKGKAKLLL